VLSYAETVSSDEFDASEILFGRAGYLTALLYLLRHLGPKSVPNEVFEKVIDTIITVGKKYAISLSSHLSRLRSLHCLRLVLHLHVLFSEEPRRSVR
jgi:cysteine synthase